MTDLTTIFGGDIRVVDQPVRHERGLIGFPGANGVASMYLGSRTWQVEISGTLRASGESYALARAAMLNTIAAINAYAGLAPADYSYGACYYYNAVLMEFQVVKDGNGKSYHWTAAGYCTCRFRAVLVGLGT